MQPTWTCLFHSGETTPKAQEVLDILYDDQNK